MEYPSQKEMLKPVYRPKNWKVVYIVPYLVESTYAVFETFEEAAKFIKTLERPMLSHDRDLQPYYDIKPIR